jgi:acetyl esterase
VEDGSAGGVPSRLYLPAEASAPGPLLIYYHGGGWARGSLTTHDAGCRLLAHLSGVRILSVDYRLAPEHPFPAGADDALAAYAEVSTNAGDFGADTARLAVGGDSAGGNLAAVTAQSVRNRGLRPAAFQLLIYPVTDLAGKTESYRTFSTGFSLTERNMDWYADQYVPDPGRRDDPRVSPLRAASLAGLPPAYVATALADPLRDEGEAYARRLAEAGVRVALQRHPLIHGFVNIGGTRAARQALALTAGALRQGLA